VVAHALAQRGWSISAIARHLERDRKTARPEGLAKPRVETRLRDAVSLSTTSMSGPDQGLVCSRQLLPGRATLAEPEPPRRVHEEVALRTTGWVAGR
jgi:hypothetical protein